MRTSNPCDSGLIDEALRHWPKLFGFAYALTKDRGRAEDHCQEAIVRLSSSDRPVDRSRPLLPLLFRVVRNLVIDEARRPETESIDGIDEHGEPYRIEPADEQDPIREVLRSEQIRGVRSALDRLPASWRAVLYLRDGLDLPYREIAEVEGTTEDVVRVTLHRARQRIRVLLTPEAPGGTER